MNTALVAIYKQVRCLIEQLDAMRDELGASAEDMHEFASGLTDAEWAQLAEDASAVCPCEVKHAAPSLATQGEVLNVLYRRMTPRQFMQRALARRLHSGRHLEVIR